jgi:hypothetical protein
MNTLEYKSFILRLWWQTDDRSAQANWEAEIEHIQSGERWKFQTVKELLVFLRSTMEPGVENKE